MVFESFSALEVVIILIISIIGSTILLSFITGFIALFFDFIRDCVAGKESSDYQEPKTP